LLITETFYTLSIITLKLSLGIFFLRILVLPWQKRVIYSAMAASTIIGTVYFFLRIFQCGGFSNIWEFLERRMTLQGCIPIPATLAVAYTQASASALSDWTYALLPLFALYDARMRRGEKLTVLFILSLATVYAHRLLDKKTSMLTTPLVEA
jgi:hypothetical protein